MEHTQQEAIITEKKSYLKVLLITLVSLVTLFALYQGYLLYQKNLITTYSPESLNSYGLDGGVETNTLPSGRIYYSTAASVEDDGDTYSHVYSYTMSTGDVTLVSKNPMSSFITIDDDSALVLAPRLTYAPESDWQPQIYNLKTDTLQPLDNGGGYNLKNLTLSPDGREYGYSYTEGEGDDFLSENISDWKTVIQDRTSTDAPVISNAVSLEWVPATDEVLYISMDGIHSLHTQTKQDRLVYTGSYGYNAYDEITVSDDGNYIVLTKPSINAIVILHKANDSWVEIGRVVTSNFSYSSPAFAKNSLQYSVVSTKISNLQTDENGSTTYDKEIAIESRYVLSKNLVNRQVVPKSTLGSVVISTIQTN